MYTALPSGTVVLSIASSGKSYWARTARIEVQDAAGDKVSFFVKVHQGEHGRNMVSAEFEAMTVLYKAAPDMVAKPIAWGSYEAIPDTHFFLCEFLEMSSDKPDGAEFAALIAAFHERSVSPDGKFGFPYTTFGGRNPQKFPVSDSWEECYAQGMQVIFAAELETHGRDEELEFLTTTTIEKVIPRLLGVLRDANGGQIIPRLVHGDLWNGNIAVDAATTKPIIFDATPLYAHNECKMLLQNAVVLP